MSEPKLKKTETNRKMFHVETKNWVRKPFSNILPEETKDDDSSRNVNYKTRDVFIPVDMVAESLPVEVKQVNNKEDWVVLKYGEHQKEFDIENKGVRLRSIVEFLTFCERGIGENEAKRNIRRQLGIKE